jgi:TrmH family RNA methyltransferase
MMSQYPVPIPDMITSTANDEVKRLRALHERKFRKQTGWFLAEGIRICHEAVDLGWAMHRLAFVAGREDEQQVKRLLVGLVKVKGRALPMTQSLLQRISRKDNPQIVLGAFGQRWDGLDHIDASKNETWVALDRVRDPGNLGTVMRSADAVGATGLILIGNCTDPYSVEAVRASMGAVFSTRIIACSESAFLKFAASWQGRIVGTALSKAVDYRKANYNRPLIMLMGNEQSGLTDNLTKVCSQLIKLPMLGRSDSLNLAVATGIVLYQALASRN